MRLKNKIAIITGGASGMGRAEAEAFAAEGATVIVADMNGEMAGEVVAGICASGGVAMAVRTDVTNEADLQNLVSGTIAQYGRIDILINNAGVFDKYATSLETSGKSWDFIFNINVKSVFNLTNLVLPGMIERGQGTIVNIASVAGLVAGKGGAAYTASKHALIGYTKHLASVYGRNGIKINAICPGTISTPLIEASLADIPTDAIPLNRFGQAGEVAELAVFLASDEAKFMQGAMVPIDGGFTIL
ncbi:glucose 1-dehydrogenase [Salmonella enterica subsp. salamae]|nr:glucose 1-dehydrogenase [Salmonella enterica subsp. salamae]ECJ2282598.1 glucose 1-dehydrogenase [Salmonella enterica subsp. salamae]